MGATFVALPAYFLVRFALVPQADGIFVGYSYQLLENGFLASLDAVAVWERGGSALCSGCLRYLRLSDSNRV